MKAKSDMELAIASLIQTGQRDAAWRLAKAWNIPIPAVMRTTEQRIADLETTVKALCTWALRIAGPNKKKGRKR